MELVKGSHCRYQIRYHIVWKVKYSRNIFFGDRVKYFKDLVSMISKRYEYNLEAVGVDKNHVHIFVGAHPSISPAKLVQTLKSITARELFKKYPDIKKYLWGGHLWAIGYYVRTVSDGPLDKVIKKYVDSQNKVRKTKKKRLYQLKLVP